MGNLNKGSLLKAALWGGVALCTPMASTAAWATDVDAGDYVALPPGSNLAIVYAQFAERDAIYAKGTSSRVIPDWTRPYSFCAAFTIWTLPA